MMQRHTEGRRSMGWRKGLAAACVLAVGLVWWFPAAGAAQAPVVQHFYLLTLASDGRLNVQERILLNNPGTALPGGSVKFYLPEGAINITPHAGGTMVADKDAVTVQGQVPTGKSAFDFGYILPYTGVPHFQLRQKSDFATEQVIILTPAEGMWVGGQGVADSGVQKSGETQYRMFTLKNLALGKEVILTAGTGNGSQQASFWGINAHLLLAGGILILVAAVIAVAVIVVRRRSKRKMGA